MAGKGDNRREGEDTKAFDDGHAHINWPSEMQHRCGAFKCPLSGKCARRALPSEPGASRCDFSHGLNDDKTECSYRKMWSHGVEVK